MKIEGARRNWRRGSSTTVFTRMDWKGKLMRGCLWILLAVSLVPLQLHAKVVVLWQPGFPTVSSQPLDRASLDKALDGQEPVFVDEAGIAAPDALANVDLLVLPYGSAFPVAAWKSIERYLGAGGNLLILGGPGRALPMAFRLFVAARAHASGAALLCGGGPARRPGLHGWR
jgi:hypothetical protein